MSGIVIPEIIIYNTLETIKTILKKNITDNAATPEKSILYRMLALDSLGQAIKINNYNYFEQAKKIFSKDHFLSVNFGYNFDVAKDLSLHIMLPSESAVDSSLGTDSGYIIDEEVQDDGAGNLTVSEIDTLTQMFESNYQIMITSNNSNEVNITYNILKGMLIILLPHLEVLGLKIPKLSGNDIMMQDDLIPVPVFHKVLNLSFKYEITVDELVSKEVIKSFVFEGNMFQQI